MNDLYRLVYTSINLLEGTESQRAEMVAEILATSQRNNSKVGVTGALLFNGGCFAQVLEGPRKAVETTFERIQRDPRHSDVSVLQCEAVESRGFSNWSMAFIGHSAQGRALWNEIASRTGFDLGRIEGDQLFVTLRAIVEAEEGSAPSARPVAPGPSVVAEQPVPLPQSETVAARKGTLDIERVRSELLTSTPGKGSQVEEALAAVGPALPRSPERAARADAASPEGAVLRKALAEERQRTTDLRRLLDDARIALTIAMDEVATLRHHRDHWADRARALASVLCQDPGTGSGRVAPDQQDDHVPSLRSVG